MSRPCISRAPLTAHDGTIDVMSAVGIGGTFTVRLPSGLEQSSEEAVAATPA